MRTKKLIILFVFNINTKLGAVETNLSPTDRRDAFVCINISLRNLYTVQIGYITIAVLVL